MFPQKEKAKTVEWFDPKRAEAEEKRVRERGFLPSGSEGFRKRTTWDGTAAEKPLERPHDWFAHPVKCLMERIFNERGKGPDELKGTGMSLLTLSGSALHGEGFKPPNAKPTDLKDMPPEVTPLPPAARYFCHPPGASLSDVPMMVKVPTPPPGSPYLRNTTPPKPHRHIRGGSPESTL